MSNADVASSLRWRLENRKADGDRFEDWSLDASGNVYFSKIVENDSDVAAIVCAGTPRGLERRQRLTIAAPDLLATVKELKLLFQSALLCTTAEIAKDGMVYVRKAEALIAKVEGRS
jgi:hypothetical protein